MYRGSIPGRIILTPKAFQFRTSRMTGGRVLVHYNWDDITGIKKTKSIDVLLWHTNGLTITTTDGEVTFPSSCERSASNSLQVGKKNRSCLLIMLSSGMIASTWQLPRASTGNEAEKERRTYLLHPLLAFLLYIYIYIYPHVIHT